MSSPSNHPNVPSVRGRHEQGLKQKRPNLTFGCNDQHSMLGRVAFIYLPSRLENFAVFELSRHLLICTSHTMEA